MGQQNRLGDLQLAIMRVLWDLGEAPVSEVHAALLEERGLAMTTISTMLRKMEKKGVVTHRSEGRQFIYHPVVAEGEVSKSMVGDLVHKLFSGDAVGLVNHLVNEGEIDLEQLDDLRRRLADESEDVS